MRGFLTTKARPPLFTIWTLVGEMTSSRKP